MKFIILLSSAVSFLLREAIFAQTPQKLKIEEAIVFLNGAELYNSADLNLTKGENEIVFTNVAGDINSKSITVSASNGVVVESATFQNNYLAPEKPSPQVKEIKDSIELLNLKKEEINNRISGITEQTAVLQANRKVGGENTGLSVAELSKMLDLAGNKMDDYLARKTKEQTLLKKTDDLIAKLNNQLNEIQNRGNQPEGVLRVKFYATQPTSTSVIITYVSTHAGWSPTYDIYADNVNRPVKLFYKANIHQSSGVNWSNVHLSLSTGNPVEGVQAPVMPPWYLAFYVPVQKMKMAKDNAPRNRRSEELTVNSYKKPLLNHERAEQASIDDFVSVDNSGVNTTFDIDQPYTIPADGQQHLVAVKKYEVPATYRYFAIPKTDKDAFLQARVTNWEDLNLLPGPTNIFYEGTYVGQGEIDTRNLTDTLDISLGRDKKIVVKREMDKKLRSVKTIGTNVKETFAYTISVRNTRKENINLILLDQQPVSNDKDIVLEDTDYGNSEFDPATGLMKWTLSVAPNETKKLSFGYTVKYPKGKTVANLK